MNFVGTCKTEQVYVPPVWMFWRRPLYLVVQDKDNPLCLEMGGQTYYMPDKYLTDFGSVPRVGQIIVPKDQYLRQFLFHDLEFSMQGVIMRHPSGRLGYRPTTLSQANHRLLLGCRWQDKAWPVHCLIHAAVATCGAFLWHRWADSKVALTVIDCIRMGSKEITWPWKMNLKEYGIYYGD